MLYYFSISKVAVKNEKKKKIFFIVERVLERRDGQLFMYDVGIFIKSYKKWLYFASVL